MPERPVKTYSGVHMRLKRRRRPAAEQRCTCGKPAAEWAYTHDDPCQHEQVDPRGQKYSTDLSRYVPMCRRCHRIYDKSMITHCPAGHPYSGENLLMDAGKRKCRTCVYARNRTHKPNAAQQGRRNELQRIRRAKAQEVAA